MKLEIGGVIAVGLLLVVLVFATMPSEVCVLSIFLSLDEDFDLVFNPTYFLSSVPRYTLWTQPSTSLRSRYDVMGITSVFLDVNVTAWNINGTTFFDGRVILDTLGEQKITFYREYDAALFSKNLTVKIDAYLFVDRTTETDIEKSYSGQWSLMLP